MRTPDNASTQHNTAHPTVRPLLSLRRRERGNMFMALFGAVAVVGVLGATIMSVMRGPLSTMVEVNRREQAKAELRVAASLVLSNSGDTCSDGDSYKVGPQPITGTSAPGNGGNLPSIGTKQMDPWGTPYGYCAWNHGPTFTACGNVLAGENSTTKIAIAVISAGPDRTFNTDCFAGGTSPNDYVYPYDGENNGGEDDIVVSMTYDQAISASGGLWTLDEEDDTIAEISKNLNVTGSSSFSGNVAVSAAASMITDKISPITAGTLSYVTIGDGTDQYGIRLGDVDSAQCAAGASGVIRYNSSGELELCNGSSFEPISGLWRKIGTGPDIFYGAGDVIIGASTDPSHTLEVSGTLGATGDTDLGGALDVDGATTLGSTVDVTGDFDIGGGDFTVNAANGNTLIGGTLDVTGAADLDSTLTVADTLTVNGGGIIVNNGASKVFEVDSDGNIWGQDTDLDGVLTVMGPNATGGDFILDLQNNAASTVFSVDHDGNVTLGTLSQLRLSDNTAGNILVSDGTEFISMTAFGDATIDGTNGIELSDNVVDQDELDASGSGNGYCLKAGTGSSIYWEACSGGGGGDGVGFDGFTDLADTPDSYAASAGDALKVVRVNAAGDGLEFVTAGSVAGAIDDLSDAYYQGSNMFIGHEYATTLTTNSSNLGVGKGTLDSLTDTTGGSKNVALGNNALTALETGSENVALGNAALWKHQTGSRNVSIGMDSMRDGTTGSQNIAIGAYALEDTNGSENVGIGNGAGGNNNTGSRSVFIGNAAGGSFQATGNAYNVALGYQALMGVGATSTGINNIALGSLTGSTISTGSNNILIGHDVEPPTATTNEYMNIGGILFGDVGITSTNPRVGAHQYCDETLIDCFTVSELDSMGIWQPDGTGDYIEYDDSLGGIRVASVAGQPAPLSDWTLDTGNSIVYTANRVLIGDTAISGSLSLDVNGRVGATHYCDADGANCVAAATLAGAATPKLNSITAADGAATINNAAHEITWNWNTLTTGFGLTMASSSVTSGAPLRAIVTNTAATGSAIYAENNSTSNNGSAIFATMTGNSGITRTIQAMNYSSTGRGVMGRAMATTGINAGVYGQSESSNGRGVIGDGASTTGANAGVYGTSASDTGYGGYFTNTNASPGWALYAAQNVGIAAGKYLNFGSTQGTTGYGIRDNAGVIECKSSGGAWAACGGGIQTVTGQPAPLGITLAGLDDTSTSGATTGNCLVYDGTNWVDGACGGGSIWVDLTGGRIHYGTTSANQVGIGTDNPGYTLDVNGDIHMADGGAFYYDGRELLAANVATHSVYLTMEDDYNTVASDATGQNNVAVGYAAGVALSTGEANTIVGSNAGLGISTGNSNVMVGSQAGLRVNGNSNVIIGERARGGNSSTTALNNSVIIGSYASDGGEGDWNVVLGSYANGGRGGHNVVIGGGVGENFTTGTDNIMIGFDIEPPAGDSTGYISIGNALFGDTGASSGDPKIGAAKYCDENLANCFTVAAAGGLWENNSNVFRVKDAGGDWSADDFVFGSSQLDDVSGQTWDAARIIFDKSKAAFRAGASTGTTWNDANRGQNSIGLGADTMASGQNSVAIGPASQALGTNATALGAFNSAGGSYSTVLGYGNTTNGFGSIALGNKVSVGTAVGQADDTQASVGNYSIGFGAGNSTGTLPRITGTSSVGFFMGDQSGVDISASNTFSIMGGKFVLGATSAPSSVMKSYAYNESTLATAGDRTSNYIQYDVTPGSNQATGYPWSGGTGESAFGVLTRVTGSSTGNVNYVTGSYHHADLFGSSSAAAMRGIYARSLFSPAQGTRTVTSMSGGDFVPQITNGTATDIAAIYANPQVGGGTATNSYGLLVQMQQWAGTNTNSYGVYLKTPLGTATNSYGFYQQGAQRNYLGGNLGLAAGNYLNFGTTNGSTGYGIRDNAGTIECKNSGGAWAACSGGGGALNGLTDVISDGYSFHFGTTSGTGMNDDLTTNSNISIGYSAMEDVTTTTQNIAFGEYAMQHHTGDKNVAIGGGSLLTAGAGSTNIAIGYEAAKLTTTGDGNVAIGVDAMKNIQTGGNNVVLGRYAGQGSTSTPNSSGGNVILGYYAAPSILSADQNVILGPNSASTLSTGDRNIIIGNAIDVPAAASNDRLNIGNLIIGDMSASVVRLPASAYLNFSTTEGSAGYGIRDNAGTIECKNSGGAWAACSGGGGSIDALSDAIHVTNSLHMGNGSGINDDLTNNGNVTVGRNSTVALTTQTGNIVVGNDSNINHTGDNNLVFGNNSLNAAGSGAGNIAIGHYTLGNAAGGYDNIAIGSGALNSNSSGNTNVAIGKDAGNGSSSSASSNTFIGAYVASGITSGGSNVAIGRAAGNALTIGSGNVLLGYQAGDNITSGANNIIIGQGVDAPIAANSNQLNIGNVVYGDISTGNASFGTSNTSPYQVQINGGTDVRTLLVQAAPAGTGPTNGHGIVLYNDHGAGNYRNHISFQANGSERYAVGNDYSGAGNQDFFIFDNVNNKRPLQIANSGDVTLSDGLNVSTRINITGQAGNAPLSPASTPAGSTTHIQFNNGGAMAGSANLVWTGSALNVTGDINYTGAIADTSDRRLKTDITPLQTADVIEKISQIDTYSFHMKDNPQGRLEFGVMAQELENIFPNLVHTADDEMGTKSVNYMGLIAPMIEATKTLKSENDTLKAELASLKSGQDELGKQVELLNKAMAGNIGKAGMLPTGGYSWLYALLGLLAGIGLTFFCVRSFKPAQ